MATQWTVLAAAAELLRIIREPDFERLRQQATQPGQSDPVQEAIEGSVNATRGQISAGGYRLSRTPRSVPPSLVEDTLWIALETATIRLRTLKLTDDQVRRIEAARATLRLVAAGRQGVEAPNDPEDGLAAQQPPRGATIIRPGRASISRHNLNGLI